jgi:hypothetical protein
MHDWILVDIVYNWGDGNCRLQFRNQSSVDCYIYARKVIKLVVPRNEEWGHSNSVNKLIGPILDTCGRKLEIQMQSGDVIVICAEKFELP